MLPQSRSKASTKASKDEKQIPHPAKTAGIRDDNVGMTAWLQGPKPLIFFFKAAFSHGLKAMLPGLKVRG